MLKTLRNRPKWHLVLFSGLALLLASSLPGCASGPPIINEFSASPAEIIAGESTTLEWSVSAAETITIDQGIGTVPYRGSLSLSPSSTIAYTLTATNDAASVTKSVVINIRIAPIPPPEQPPEEEKPEEPKQEEIINALDTDKLLDLGYNYPDQVIIVEGVIVGTYYAKSSGGQPTFLDFHDPYQGYFTALIWGSDRPQFPPSPESYYLHKKVRVKGKIEIYEGAPEIILRQSSQIWIVE